MADMYAYNMTDKEPRVISEPKETVKMALESLGAVLRELNEEVDLIENAIYGVSITEKDIQSSNNVTPPMLHMVREHRDLAERVLKKLIHIRDGLW